MSYRSHCHPHDHGGHSHRRSAHAGASHRQATHRGAAEGYTLAHAGRQVRIGPAVFWSIIGTLAIMASWTIATATYFAFQDDLLTRLIARHAETQYAYEDRITDLRTQVDRLASRQLLDQEQYEQKLEQIVRRQMMLESRAASMPGADPTPTGSIRSHNRPNSAGERASTPAPSLKPSPMSDTVILAPPPDREARLESRVPSGTVRAAAKVVGSGLEGALNRLQASLDHVEAAQVASLNLLEESFENKARRMRSVLADLGLDFAKVETAKLPGHTGSTATGGPYVPASHSAPSAFERQLYRINLARAQVEKLNRTLVSVPVRRPMAGDIETTSGFGMRMDPFLRTPAMHTGLDFRGDVGDPVRATAAGSVIVAGWSGGYGKMVEIDHGNGFSTRYAHLSSIDVESGQSVRVGQILGRVGSTGRSTGPHLHYETRIEGDAVDPQRFLRAGLRLGAAK